MHISDNIRKTGIQYYVDDNNLDKNNDFKKVKNRIRPLEDVERRLISEKLKKAPETIDFKRLRQSNKEDNVINNYEELICLFRGYDLRYLFHDNLALDAGFPCNFLDGNNAWVSRSERGHYRYFSKDKNDRIIALDLVDIASLYYNVSQMDAITMLASSLKIKFLEHVWFRKQNEKYLANMTIIHSATKYIKEDYPELYSALKPHLKLYETLNVIGNVNIKKQEYSYKQCNIFFSSSKYLADFMAERHYSTINKIINYLCVFGLIEKVPLNKVPYNLLKESIEISKKRNLGNTISYYIIPPIVDQLKNANNIAIKLKKERISYSNISYGKIKDVFGEEFADKIYVQEIQKIKNIDIKRTEEFECRVHEILTEQLEKEGYCRKIDIASKIKSRIPQKAKLKMVENVWNKVLKSKGCIYCKPTKDQKKMYGLSSNEYIAIAKI